MRDASEPLYVAVYDLTDPSVCSSDAWVRALSLSADADQPRRSTASRLPLRLAHFLKAALHAANGRRLHVRRAAGRTRFGLTRSTGWSSNKTPRPSSQQLQFRLRLHIETPQLIFTQTRLGQQ